MKNSYWFVALIIMLSCVSSRAQEVPTTELFGGFSFLTVGAGIRETAWGWQSSAAFNINRNVGLVADFGGQYKTLREGGTDVSLAAHEFLFGPRFTARWERTTPFVHFLLGGANGRASVESERVSKTVLATANGGGLDLNVNDRLAVRLIQLDWVPVRLEDQWYRNVARLGIGLVFKSGR